jgi:hypothetical protein
MRLFQNLPMYVPGKPKRKTRTKINWMKKKNISENLPSIPGAPGGPE